MTDDSITIGGLFEAGILLIGVSLLGVALVVGLVAWALYKAGRRQRSAAIVTSLSLLAVLSLVGYALGGDTRAELIPLASLAIGALAAALGQLSKSEPDTPEPEQSPVID